MQVPSIEAVWQHLEGMPQQELQKKLDLMDKYRFYMTFKVLPFACLACLVMRCFITARLQLSPALQPAESPQSAPALEAIFRACLAVACHPFRTRPSRLLSARMMTLHETDHA